MSSTTSPTRPFDAAVALAPTNVRWRIFLLMLMLIAINYIDRASISVAMPVISKEFNIDLSDAGVCPQLLLPHLRADADPGRHARRPVQAARRHRRRDARLGLLSGNRRGLAQRMDPRVLTRLGLGASEAPIYPAGGKLNAIWMTSN